MHVQIKATVSSAEDLTELIGRWVASANQQERMKFAAWLEGFVSATYAQAQEQERQTASVEENARKEGDER